MLHSATAGALRAGRNRHPRHPRERAIRIVVIVFLVAIVSVLFAALVFLYRDRGRGNRVMITLAIRVGLQFALIALLVLAWWMGWLHPVGG